MGSENENTAVKDRLVQNAKMAMLGELMAGVVHEIKNPLSFVNANSGNLKKFVNKLLTLIEGIEGLKLPEDSKKAIEELKKEANYDHIQKRLNEMIDRNSDGVKRMTKIVMSISAFARSNTETMEEDDIHDAIDTTLEILYHEYKNRITIVKEYGELPPVKCNIGKMNQVFMNLIINACHAIKDTGEIRIKTALNNGIVTIDISDTGSGMPEDVVSRVFENFFTTKPVGKGTGIGLAISQDIIKQHKGEITVESIEGKGTTFSITIPVNA
ncbi:GHKL domain-containing protein [bacterium]|nr:GHKL domain-containing protein [bacterium]